MTHGNVTLRRGGAKLINRRGALWLALLAQHPSVEQGKGEAFVLLAERHGHTLGCAFVEIHAGYDDTWVTSTCVAELHSPPPPRRPDAARASAHCCSTRWTLNWPGSTSAISSSRRSHPTPVTGARRSNGTAPGLHLPHLSDLVVEVPPGTAGHPFAPVLTVLRVLGPVG
ncbi:hypothetical protein ACFU6I_26950 [Streptomyces sp. NPDC057486]|uniref:hypothetical protein n=1 Tax=Streptomyces sp. NPDC057486 TaxID=3346145 RepID=UPI003690F30D